MSGPVRVWAPLVRLFHSGLVASRYGMTMVAFFGVGWAEDLHRALVSWAEVSIAVHILAAVIESRRLGVNLPESMVTGDKTLP